MKPSIACALIAVLGCAPAVPGSPGGGGGDGTGGGGVAGRGDAGGEPGRGGSGGAGMADGGASTPDAPRADAPGPAAPDGGAMPPTGGPVALPMVVTDHFANVGWFGDGTVMAHFKPGSMVIKQGASTSGPCASRPAGARGLCLEVVYTPPAGLAVVPGAGWVGVYFLRSLSMPHPQATPPARPGEPNWGLEPGLPVMPGATRISFSAAGLAGARVTFRAGTDRDSFVLPEQSQVLSPTWSKHALELAGATYPQGVLGAFAWVLKDTTRPATFYLDDIVWESDGKPPAPPQPQGKKDGVRQFHVVNRCTQPVWVGLFGTPVPEGGGFALAAGQTRVVVIPPGVWTGRIWGRTGCRFDAGGAGSCETGDCGARLMCGGTTGKTPATLAEFTMGDGGVNPDFYDLSLVDGYNLPMAIAPLEGTYTKTPGAAFNCLVPTCTSDLNATCPPELRLTNPAGQVVGCLSACEKFKTDQYCCAGAHDKPETCPPFSYSRAFKAACPTAYSYAYDDATSTFTCKGEDYAIWFCP